MAEQEKQFDTSSCKVMKSMLAKRNPKTGKLELTSAGEQFSKKASAAKSK